jgi:hypothetical protein
MASDMVWVGVVCDLLLCRLVHYSEHTLKEVMHLSSCWIAQKICGGFQIIFFVFSNINIRPIDEINILTYVVIKMNVIYIGRSTLKLINIAHLHFAM